MVALDPSVPAGEALAAVAARLPDAAKDLRLNLAGVQRSEVLDGTELWGAILASALASGNPDLIAAASRDAGAHLSPELRAAAHTAAALMAMNNVYYRSLHLMEDPGLDGLPARLRMQGLRGHGAPERAFELWCLAVSAVNGCGRCLTAHAATLARHGATPPMLQEALRVAAVLSAVGETLTAHDALAPALS